MKRVVLSLAAVLALASVIATAVQAQESTPSNAPGATTQQPATQTPTSTSDQPATTTSSASTSSGSSMPATAGPLPLVGMGGLASLAVGALLARRPRKD
jgi:cytoskeletal protein RodZ